MRRHIRVVLLALAVASGLLLYYVFRSAPSNLETATPVVSAPRATTPARPAPPSAPASLVWGNARNSANSDGAGFFSPADARAFIATVAAEQRKYVIEFVSRAFLPDAAVRSTKEILPDDGATHSLYLQFAEHPTPAERAVLAADGVELLHYMTARAWLARGTAAAFDKALALPNVRAVAAIDSRDKLHPEIHRGQFPARADVADGRTRLSLIALPGSTSESIVADLAARGVAAELSPRAPSVLGPRFELTVNKNAAALAAASESVAYLEPFPEAAGVRDPILDNQSNVNDVRDEGPLLSGSGVKVAVREIGRPASHVDLDTRLQFVDSDGVVGGSVADHATSVVGQVAGSGDTVPSAKGIAPEAQLLVYSLVDGDFATTDVINAAGQGVRLSNHSYGPVSVGTFGDYRSISADWDKAIADNDLIGFFAGNEEPGVTFNHIDYFVGAKNTICVSSTNSNANAGDTSPPVAPQAGAASFAQHGPMADGRVKPDLVAYGEDVLLLVGTNGSKTNSGTSFSTPAICGAGALVFERYKSVVGVEPTGAQAKSLLVNAATDVGNLGPDATYGFGILNVEEAIRIIDLRTSASDSPFNDGVVANGETRSFKVTVQNLPLLKATLCWMDPAGTPGVAKPLINDLDIELTAPDGTKHFPFSLSASAPSALATATAANTVDPIEQVAVVAPANGEWTITVRGSSIPSGSQSFSVCANTTSPKSLIANIVLSPGTGPAPLTVSFSGNASVGSIASYLWTFGDGGTAQGADVDHEYKKAGTYRVVLTVTDSAGNTAVATAQVVVTRKEASAFGSKGTIRLTFTPGRQTAQLQFTLTIPDLVLTPQRAREALRDGLFEGRTFSILLGTPNPDVLPVANTTLTEVAKVILDRRAAVNDKDVSFKVNPLRGQVTARLKESDAVKLLATLARLGFTEAPVSKATIPILIRLEGEDTAYTATMNLSYTSARGKGSAKLQR